MRRKGGRGQEEEKERTVMKLLTVHISRTLLLLSQEQKLLELPSSASGHVPHLK
jgi:hypothetical protein